MGGCRVCSRTVVGDRHLKCFLDELEGRIMMGGSSLGERVKPADWASNAFHFEGDEYAYRRRPSSHDGVDCQIRKSIGRHHLNPLEGYKVSSNGRRVLCRGANSSLLQRHQSSIVHPGTAADSPSNERNGSGPIVRSARVYSSRIAMNAWVARSSARLSRQARQSGHS